MKGRVLVRVVVTIALMMPGVVFGTERRPVATYQPFDTPNGIILSPVTYVGYYTPLETSIVATGWQNRVWHSESKSYTQENVAHTAGLRVTVGFQGLDTLTATIDASRLASFHSENGNADTLLLAATVECLKANVGQSSRVLRLAIVGAKQYQRYAGTFDVSDYRCGPKSRQFDMGVAHE